ncbi:dihydrodipicolinate synthase family protein [Alkalicoccus luteus]|uniref:Dihydrodipicolinate synthase family protein n=1 Tax=Alkalicoccus luteus TaxID=1237094 RepID=A0A969PW97_9BACI|nr:dihydrodipicolinate synthase family protein [Alkalicoccus luteus]NJP39048.1 dihydrodipicolinate synthase family protein [Alkalicoccus luteus]
MLYETMHVAVPTVFDQQENVNMEATNEHIKSLQKKGVRSVLISGSTGEQHSLSVDERLEMMESINEVLLQQMEILFGIAAVRLKDAEKLAAKASETKLSGVMIGFPPYIRPSQAEAVAYAKRLIERCQKPVILYNNPGRTGFDLSSESAIILAQNENVIGIKDLGGPEKIQAVQNGLDREFSFYAGGEEGLAEKIRFGYNRLSSIAGNVYPVEIKQWLQQLLANETPDASEQKDIERMMQMVYSENPIVRMKHELKLGSCRSPLGMSSD